MYLFARTGLSMLCEVWFIIRSSLTHFPAKWSIHIHIQHPISLSLSLSWSRLAQQHIHAHVYNNWVHIAHNPNLLNHHQASVVILTLQAQSTNSRALHTAKRRRRPRICRSTTPPKNPHATPIKRPELVHWVLFFITVNLIIIHCDRVVCIWKCAAGLSSSTRRNHVWCSHSKHTNSLVF